MQLPLLILLGIAGFCLALYIHWKKSKSKPLVCLIGHDCDAVVRSDYAVTFGVPNEVLGMLYYAFIAVVYGALLAFPELSFPEFSLILQGVTGFAFAFSVYLIGIQVFILKNFCEWCIVSSVLSAIICVLVFMI